MNAKKTIQKILFIAFWLCIGGGMLTLLLAAIHKKNNGLCKGYTISISGGEKNRFIDEKDVEQMMLNAAGGNIKGQSVASINLNRLEQTLEKNVWISRAELYFDNRDELHINVTEKEPVARVFTTEGNSFYIDSAANKLPLSEKLSARVPVFTGFPEKKVLNSKDSVLLNDVRKMAVFILHNDFWMSQVSQIDITPDRVFEMIPVVGHHVVKLGRGDDLALKFRRLLIFYQQVLRKAGFNKYRTIDVQYAGQVVVSRLGADTKVDSVQLRKNVEKLLKAAQHPKDEKVGENTPAPVNTLAEMDKPEENISNNKTEKTENTGEKENQTENPVKRPKAVMPKRINN